TVGAPELRVIEVRLGQVGPDQLRLAQPGPDKRCSEEPATAEVLVGELDVVEVGLAQVEAAEVREASALSEVDAIPGLRPFGADLLGQPLDLVADRSPLALLLAAQLVGRLP